MIHIPQVLQVANLLSPQADGVLTSDYINLDQSSRKVYVKVSLNQGNAAQCTITLGQSTDNAGTGAKALSGNAQIYYNEDMAAGGVMTKSSTPAKSYQFSATLKQKVVWFEIPIENCIDINNDFTHLYVTSSGSNAANILSVECIFESKNNAYMQSPLD